MDTAQAKQQVVERLKQANNILVTVSDDPSVDQLSACIGMTLFLNKLEKHATAVYSGKTPPAIEFLQPEKTIESNTDSLRDFIISLDKAKADKLRYKVEDKFVRIYITPYRTSLSEKDLVFSEGDFNVDVVLALGVRDKTHLDAAITQHGRILHDASVISVNSGQEKAPDIGQVNWQDPAASSLSEMLVSISEAFGTGLIDNQMATAFLTGIVAETERFSNPKTSPKVMTMAAQLMAAGANQQLIVSKLEPPPPPEAAKPVKPPKPPQKPPTDTLTVSHDEAGQDSPEVEVKPDEIHIDAEGNIIAPPEPKAKAVPEPVPPPAPVELPKPSPPAPIAFEPLKSEPPQSLPEAPQPPPAHTKPMIDLPEPVVKEEPREVKSIPKPHELLDPTDHKPAISPPFTADTQPAWYEPENSVPLDPLSEESRSYIQDSTTPTFPTPEVDSARSAVSAAMAAAPFNPAIEGPVAALNAQPMGKELHPESKQLAPEKVIPPIFSGNHMDDRPAPPPVPPPLKLDSGTLIPTTSSPEPIKTGEPALNLPKVL